MSMKKIDLRTKRILVTGGAGFVGSYVMEALLRRGVPREMICSPTHAGCDLTFPEEVRAAFDTSRPQIVIHAAAKVGGIGYNAKYPADVFRDNFRMTLNVLDEASRADVEKVTFILAACLYPGDLTGDLDEKDIAAGPLHPTVEAYAASRRALLVGTRAYARQYGLNYSLAVPTNLYGPRDTFDVDRSHAACALIRKFVDARQDGKDAVVCWGTGSAVREFLWVADAAEAIVRLTELAEYRDPVNLGIGRGTTIRELANLTARLTGYKGAIVWDETKPDGAARKVLVTTRAKEVLDWEPQTKLEDGLQTTIDWYVENRRGLGY